MGTGRDSTATTRTPTVQPSTLHLLSLFLSSLTAPLLIIVSNVGVIESIMGCFESSQFIGKVIDRGITGALVIWLVNGMYFPSFASHSSLVLTDCSKVYSIGFSRSYFLHVREPI